MRSNGMFWGVIFLTVGIIIIIQTVFKIDLPIMRLLFGVALIYWGIKVIFGSFGINLKGFNIEKVSSHTEAIFSESDFKARKTEGGLNRKFSTAFGSSILDLSDLKEEELLEVFKIENGFGKTVVKTNPNYPIKADISAGFASVVIRGQKVGAFGETEFQTPGWESTKPHLRLKIETGFGEVIVE